MSPLQLGSVATSSSSHLSRIDSPSSNAPILPTSVHNCLATYATPENFPTRIQQSLNDPLLQPVVVPVICKRDKIARELLETEQSYYRSLIIIDVLFRQPMLEAAKRNQIPVNEDYVHRIFSRQFDEIKRINSFLLEGLFDRLSCWNQQQQLGDVLLKLVPFLKTYNSYTANYQNASDLVRDILQRKEGSLFKFMERIVVNPPYLDLSSYLIMPIQRIPRYRLLLEELIKNTYDEHIDYPQLVNALNSIKVVANQIDAAICQHRNRMKMFDIQESFANERIQIIEAGRLFIHEGELYKQCRKDTQKRMFWLFNDKLLYAKYVINGKYSRVREFDLTSLTIKELSTWDEEGKFAFQIETQKKSFVVLTSTWQEKKLWLNHIHSAIGKLEESCKTLKKQVIETGMTTMAPVWVPDSQVPICSRCSTKFTIIERRHHCRQCGNVVCASCSNRKKELPGQGRKRVCIDCYVKPFPETSEVLKVLVQESIQEDTESGIHEKIRDKEDNIKYSLDSNSTSLDDMLSIEEEVNLVGNKVREENLFSNKGIEKILAEEKEENLVEEKENLVEEKVREQNLFGNKGTEDNINIPQSHLATQSAIIHAIETNQIICSQYVAIEGYTVDPGDYKKLSFSVGDVLDVFKKSDRGWWMAKLEDRIGWVPSTYLNPLYISL